MIYSAHQPDLLPYSGFWYKMAKADVFDLKIWDQFISDGYQRRAIMRGQWASLPLVKSSSTAPINTKRLKPEAPGVLVDEIVKRYVRAHHKKPPHWAEYGPRICDEILSIKTDLLWDFNFQLILLIRDILEINTPVTFSRPAMPGLRGSAGIISVIQNFAGPMSYLSGTGGRSYMGDCREFTEANIPVIWTRHVPVTGDCILTVLFDYDDPKSIVNAETEQEQQLNNLSLEGASL